MRSELKAVLLDRDGTIVVDVPYNGDPERVVAMPGAEETLNTLRAAGVSLGVLTNQSGIARGLITADQVEAVNQRVEHVLGPFDVWEICPHGPDDGCTCRKPAPGMILRACEKLGLLPSQVAFIGDIGADIEAAAAAGATGVLVPTPVTRQEEIDAAPLKAESLAEAVAMLRGAA
jgi:D-glycero-D-manno-heptose 1,7-bisphosphate phosphatase